MRLISKVLLAAAGLAAFAFSPANAYEGGYAGWQTKPGAFIGSSAGVPPPGIYMFNQIFTYQTNLTGPGTSGIGNHVGVQAAVDVQGFLFVPGWTFLGATYDAVIVQPWVMFSVGSPVDVQAAGMHNTYLVPVELSWKFGDSGFNVKTGLGIGTPDGTVTGVTGLGNNGNPWWTFQPELILSYLKDGWNLSVAMYDEINTANTIDNYTTGNIFHADFTATKTIGKWTIGSGRLLCRAGYERQMPDRRLQRLLRPEWYRRQRPKVQSVRCWWPLGIQLRTRDGVGVGNPGGSCKRKKCCCASRDGWFSDHPGHDGVLYPQLSPLGT